MSDVRNTSKDITPLEVMAMGMGLVGNRPIEAMEARGQRELVRSELLPVDGSDHPEMQKLGIEWGPPVDGDPLFRHAKLPAGWSKRATEHSMHNDVIDEKGRVRATIFYKAAFYDRRAHINPYWHYLTYAIKKGDEYLKDYDYSGGVSYETRKPIFTKKQSEARTLGDVGEYGLGPEAKRVGGTIIRVVKPIDALYAEIGRLREPPVADIAEEPEQA